MRSIPTRALLLILVSSLLLTPACSSDDVVDGDDDGDSPTNEASMEVSGAVEAEYAGTAIYSTIAGGAAHAITITFDDGEGSASITIEELTDEGSYLIGQTTAEPAALEVTLSDVAALDGTLGGFVLIESGSITITNIDDNLVEGRFNGTGETNATGNPELSVEGDFKATCLNAPGVTC